MRKYIVYLITATALLVAACKFNPNLQGRGEESLQGVWEQDSVPYKDLRLHYTRHSFRFSCDSVYIEIETNAKASYIPDSCYNNGQWKEYAKGTYTSRSDTILISATFTKKDFKQKISGCYRVGQYRPVFVIKNRDARSLLLANLADHAPVKLNLIARTKCDPKPL